MHYFFVFPIKFRLTHWLCCIHKLRIIKASMFIASLNFHLVYYNCLSMFVFCIKEILTFSLAMTGSSVLRGVVGSTCWFLCFPLFACSLGLFLVNQLPRLYCSFYWLGINFPLKGVGGSTCWFLCSPYMNFNHSTRFTNMMFTWFIFG